MSIFKITENDINCSNGNFVINNPGKYVFCENIRWKSKSDTVAVSVSCNNVFLDGLGYTIQQDDSQYGNCVAILINSGCKSIYIQNIIFENISGQCIWFQGTNTKCIAQKNKYVNCCYDGCGKLNSMQVISAILVDVPENLNESNSNIQITSSTFTEIGISKDYQKWNSNSTAALAICKAENVTIIGVAIDGVVGDTMALGFALIGISALIVDDVILTDIISSGFAKDIYCNDVGGTLKHTQSTSVYSQIPPDLYTTILSSHSIPGSQTRISNDSVNSIHSNQIHSNQIHSLKILHLRAIIPNRTESFNRLYSEHVWKEFRTLGRLVAHNSHLVSKTSEIYALWTTLFWERILGIKVSVVGGFANLYESGSVPLSLHRDEYKSTQGQGIWAFSLSFGETRKLVFVPDDTNVEQTSFDLADGDIFVFAPEINSYYQHKMDKEPERTGRRINLTYFLEIQNNTTVSLNIPDNIKVPNFEECVEILDRNVLKF